MCVRVRVSICGVCACVAVRAFICVHARMSACEISLVNQASSAKLPLCDVNVHTQTGVCMHYNKLHAHNSMACATTSCMRTSMAVMPSDQMSASSV